MTYVISPTPASSKTLGVSAVKKIAGTSLDYASSQGNRKHKIQPLSAVLRNRQQKFRPLSAAKRTARIHFDYCHLSEEQKGSKHFDHCQLSKKQATHDSNTDDKLHTIQPLPAVKGTNSTRFDHCQLSREQPAHDWTSQLSKEQTEHVSTAISCRGNDKHTIGPLSAVGLRGRYPCARESP